MKLPKVIYVMGPPGAGKGTQAEMLAQEIGYHQFSTGDAFRAIREQDTDLGRRVKETYDKGILSPPEMAAEIVIDAVQKYMEKEVGLVFDGTPRTMKESEMVDDFFAHEQYGRPLAIFLKVNKDDMVARSAKRKFCLDVAQGFPVVTEKDEEKCQSIGGRVGVRPDDAPEAQETRWTEFMTRTYPVIEKYRNEGILEEVNGQLPIEEVHRNVMNVVKQYT